MIFAHDKTEYYIRLSPVCASPVPVPLSYFCCAGVAPLGSIVERALGQVKRNTGRTNASPRLAGFAPQGDFLMGRKSPKTHQRRGLPPPCGIHPAGTRLLLRQGNLRPGGSFPVPAHATSPGSHGNRIGGSGGSIVRALPWKSGVAAAGSLVTGSWEQLLRQGRPGRGNRPAVGPAAQRGLVWWHKQGPQQGSRAGTQLDAVLTWYPRGVLRGERPKRVFRLFLPGQK